MLSQLDRKWLIGGSLGVAFLFVLAIAAWQDKSIDIPIIGSNGDVSFSDSSLCAEWESEHDSSDVASKYGDARNAYLEGKLHISDVFSGERGSVYLSGMQVNCWTMKTVSEAFARTDELVSAYGLEGAEQEFQLAVATGVTP